MTRPYNRRANLGAHVPEALDPAGSVVIAVRVTQRTANALTNAATAQALTRGAIIRNILETWVHDLPS